MVVTQPGRFSSKLAQIALPNVLINRFSETLPRVLRSYHPRHRALVCFSTQPGPSWFAGTAEMPPGALIRLSEGDSSFQRTTGPIRFAGLSVAIEDIEVLGSTFAGSDLLPPRNSLIVTPNPAAMTRLQKIHAVAGELAEHAPDVIAAPEAARGLEQAILSALADCLIPPNGKGRPTGSHLRNVIMNRFYAVLEAHPDGVLHTVDMCKAIGVSNRTLTTCCNETLGMSPYRYLKLRQLHLVRRALRRADRLATTVTVVATDHGFWDLGRFASAYRNLFGELPSATLHGGADAAPAAREHETLTLASEIT